MKRVFVRMFRKDEMVNLHAVVLFITLTLLVLVSALLLAFAQFKNG